ncbi:MAG: crotonase/enoyl-CoA hydratase family protein [Alphaproteobacteria bacterium]|nr:MAG: crotonase/enoyl-CoA hydratase family protein [Alphaproteobacteria bacterium]
MSHNCFNVSIEEGVAHIELSRPEAMNTMIPDFWRELPEIVNDISDNAKARVIVISSTGKHFSAGMDLSVFAPDPDAKPDKRTRAMTNETFRHTVRRLQETFSCLDKARMPVLMACQGGVVGGAVDFCSAADIRYCTEDAFFCIQEINIGMTADVGTFPRLCHLIPQGWVREMAYTGRRLPAAKAKEIGLVNEVYATQEEMIAAVMATAREIASKSPIAVAGSKVMINYARDHSIDDGLDYIALWQTGMFEPLEMQEAFAAKMEKREGDFPDLKPLRKALGQIS